MSAHDTTFDAARDAAGAAGEVFATNRPSRADRARWLGAIAGALDAEDGLVTLAAEETNLPAERLRGEVSRTTGQLRLFADVLEEGSYLEATIDHANPETGTPDLRRMLRPLGPVAVFSASNFPFAFSVAGGDTASALAAGCPVIVKGHSAHPRLSLRTASVVQSALRDAGAPDHFFAHVAGRATGVSLLTQPEVRAGAFTGSLEAGRRLFDIASQREDPIPFYGELSAINPVVITREVLRRKREATARALVQSFTLSAGQFCTKPGVVFVPAGEGFADDVAQIAGRTVMHPMLTEGIALAFRDGVAARVHVGGIVDVTHGSSATLTVDRPVVLQCADPAALAASSLLREECFGPMVIIVEYEHLSEVAAVLPRLGGTLTVSIHATDFDDVQEVIEIGAAIAGRVVFDGWPTGVAVTWAQTHGGPWPATTNALHTSVGAAAIRRFLRPVSFQGAPSAALPEELRDSFTAIPRRIDGALMPAEK